MGIVIGIDVGGSTTKIVGINGEQIQSPMFITATDPVTSLFGAFGKYIYDNGIQLADVEQVMLTGVGSAFVNSPLYGLPTRKTDEFIANGLKYRINYTAGNIFLRSIAICFPEKRGGSTHWQVRQSSVANITYLQVDTSYIPFLSQLGHLMNIMSFQQQP